MPKRFAAALKVLIVEDDEDDYLLTRGLLSELERPKVSLSWVSNYQDALEVIGRNEHDVYLVDYHLGERNGLELLREVRSGSNFTKPTIMLTGQERLDVDLEAMKAGAADYLLKSQVNTALLERSILHAIERAKILETLHNLASYDELTGLYNRRKMDCLLTDGVNLYKRYGRPLGLVMLDVDFFKIINDSYGHQVGDEVLRWLGALVRRTVREVDVTARYGGEELAIILPEATGRQAFEVAERLRRQINARPFTCDLEKRGVLSFSISVSLGVASLPADAESADGLVDAADRGLYEAKRQGRNRTIQLSSAHAGN
jgi:two-component system, chemotaxis family, response regulator WspR